MQSRSATTVDHYYTYMLTIACQQKKEYITKDLLDEVISYLKLAIPNFHVIQEVYENSGKYRQLHYHAIVHVPGKFWYKQFTAFGASHMTGNTYSIRWHRVYDYYRACSYLYKDLRYQTQSDILQDNYYSVNRFHEVYLS